tara:strand:- start:55 stop:261 length:207 start_codon:yes stop_codon:yes gene_type:complete
MFIKKVLQKIMSDLKSLRKQNVSKDVTLSREELEFLLELIAKSNFEGRDVQIVYETAVKLQQLITNKK